MNEKWSGKLTDSIHTSPKDRDDLLHERAIDLESRLKEQSGLAANCLEMLYASQADLKAVKAQLAEAREVIEECEALVEEAGARAGRYSQFKMCSKCSHDESDTPRHKEDCETSHCLTSLRLWKERNPVERK